MAFVLNALLERRIADRRLLALLRGLIAHGAETPGKGMPIGNLTSQMFANFFVKETLRVRHYLRYMDDFLVLVDDRRAATEVLHALEDFLEQRLALRLNPRRTVLAPLSARIDVLGFVRWPTGRIGVRRRSVVRLRRRLPALARAYQAGDIPWETVRSSIASWYGIAQHADAFRLSRAVFCVSDVRNLGKRLAVRLLTQDDGSV